MSTFEPQGFKPLENWHLIKMHLAGDSSLVAVASNPYYRTEMIDKHKIPGERTGVLLSLPGTGKVYLLKRADYERLKKKEDDAIGDRHHGSGTWSEGEAKRGSEEMAGQIPEREAQAASSSAGV